MGDIPSTDNGLESLNGKIKSQNTLRERMGVGQYLGNARTMVTDWSKDRGECDNVEKFFYERLMFLAKVGLWLMTFYTRGKV